MPAPILGARNTPRRTPVPIPARKRATPVVARRLGASNSKSLERSARIMRVSRAESMKTLFLIDWKQFRGGLPEDERSLFFRNDQQQYRKSCTPARLSSSESETARLSRLPPERS